MTDNQPSVTHWLQSLQEGSDQAAQKIWDRYFDQLTRFAKKRLGFLRRESDEEDAAITAMQSFFSRAQDGKFTELNDRDDLWKLLIVITARKVSQQQRRAMTQKRGDGTVRGESIFTDAVASDLAELVEDLQPDQILFEIKEDFQAFLDNLDDPTMQKIAFLRLSGKSTVAIADQLQCSKRSVERKLERIRQKWITYFE